jgi:GT2 family glycosyltransferase
MPDSSLGVIIVSYNTCEFLRGCLLSLRRVVDEGPFDIVVADNGSTDGSVEMLRNEFPELRLLALGQNLGFARANNRAAQETRCPEILFLNPDTVLTRGAVARLRQTLASHPSAAVVGGQLVNESGDPLASSFAFPSLWREFWNLLPELKGLFRVRALASRLSRLVPQLWRGSYRADPEARQVDSVGGACMIVRGDAFREMGGFCEEFFLYHEEMELCYRLRRQGREVWLEPRARILHYEGRSSGARHSRLAPTPVLGYRLRGMKYFWSHHHPGLRYRVWQVMVRGLLRLRAALCAVGAVLTGHDVRAGLLARAGDLRALARELKARRA